MWKINDEPTTISYYHYIPRVSRFFYVIMRKKDLIIAYEKIILSKVVSTQKSRCSIIPSKKIITKVDIK